MSLLEGNCEKELQEIIGELECPKDFKCYKSGFEVLCKAKSIGVGDGLFLVCFEKYPQTCKFLNLERGYVCECPLRIYIAKKLKK
jgi:hypothetical protein